MDSENQVQIVRIENDFPVSELEHTSWQKAKEVRIEKYWSGEKAPFGRHAQARLLWSDAALYVRFQANQTEPLVMSDTPNLKSKTKGLWNRDVCEIFIAPNRNEPYNYFEFEIAPNGEWIDIGIQLLPDGREVDWDYHSGMQSAAKIERDKITMSIKVEWKAFSRPPKAGDVWLGNLFRCVGSDETRGYLAWRPTQTALPNFHVPPAFGEFQFIK